MSDSWDAERQPVASSATVRYFDDMAGDWSQKYRQSRHFQARLATVLGWLRDNSVPLDLLDYGCGSGVLLQALAQAGHTVTGADISEGMLAEAGKQLKEVPNAGRVRLIQVNDAGDGDYRDRLYDGVISLGVLEYCAEPLVLLERLALVVKPGGFLIVSFPNRNSGLRWAERVVARYPALFRRLGLFPHLTGPDSYLQYQAGQFDLEDLTRVLATQGFQLRKTRYHVAPGWLGALEHLPWLGMTAMVQWVKSSAV